MKESVLGNVYNELGLRDAVHVAMVSVTCDKDVLPGQRMRLLSEKTAEIASGKDWNGVADPFVDLPDAYISPGVPFWFILRPGLVTGMRHVWRSALLKLGEQNDPARDQMGRFVELCNKFGFNVQGALSNEFWMANGEYMHVGSAEHLIDAWRDIRDEFWQLREQLSGNPPPKPDDEGFFSCSC